MFDLPELKESERLFKVNLANRPIPYFNKQRNGSFQLQNRRYLGNKYKLISFIEDIVTEKCGSFESFCDIFAGTGVVGDRFNKPTVKIIANDILLGNFICLKAFLQTSINIVGIEEKISYLNKLTTVRDNYFSQNFGDAYFSLENAQKIGAIRDEIDNIFDTEDEKNILICSLIYAVDKVANTVGHYDAYRKNMEKMKPVKLLVPDINYENNKTNEIYNEDANNLIKKITCDVLYVDPPYNSRQYSDAYHLLENLASWEKPKVYGVAKKMDRSHIKSSYCLRNAALVFEDLILNASCKHIILSYNNTADKKDGRSNARISDNEILRILKKRGNVEIFETDYKAFSAGKSSYKGNTERLFYCKVR